MDPSPHRAGRDFLCVERIPTHCGMSRNRSLLALGFI